METLSQTDPRDVKNDLVEIIYLCGFSTGRSTRLQCIRHRFFRMLLYLFNKTRKCYSETIARALLAHFVFFYLRIHKINCLCPPIFHPFVLVPIYAIDPQLYYIVMFSRKIAGAPRPDNYSPENICTRQDAIKIDLLSKLHSVILTYKQPAGITNSASVATVLDGTLRHIINISYSCSHTNCPLFLHQTSEIILAIFLHYWQVENPLPVRSRGWPTPLQVPLTHYSTTSFLYSPLHCKSFAIEQSMIDWRQHLLYIDNIEDLASNEFPLTPMPAYIG